MDYSELLLTINKLKSKVSIFRRVVLHSHSLGSSDYGTIHPKAKQQESRRPDNEAEYLEALSKSNVELLAITDHMKCNFACSMSEASTKTDICILPGMELNIRPPAPLNNYRIHALAIFPEQYTPDQICRIFSGEIGAERDRDGSEEIKDTKLEDMTSIVHKCGGICIAAHIDTDRGIRATFRQLGKDGILFYDPAGQLTPEEEKKISDNFKDWLLLAGFDAIEVAKAEDKEHYCWSYGPEDEQKSIAALLKNDSHRVEDLEIDEWHTHIKMTGIGYDGLKQALLFPDTRIRFPSDVPATPSPRILGIEIISGGDEGFFKTLQAAFSDNLSCLIGPRGSGKSAIIEAIRYVFGLNRQLDELLPLGTDLPKKVHDLQKATLTNCVIRIPYAKADGEIRVLEATFDKHQEYNTKVYSIDGTDMEVGDVLGNEDYPIRLFGWSEIENLGREADRQRDLLDQLIPGFSEITGQRTTLRSNLSVKQASILSSTAKLNEIIGRNNGELTKYKDYKVEFDILNTPVIDTLFTNIDTAKGQLILLSKLKSNIANWISEIEKTIEFNLLSGIEELVTESLDEVKAWWSVNQMDNQTQEKRQATLAELTKGRDILKTYSGELDASIEAISKELQDKEKELRDSIGEEATKQIAADLRRAADERLQRVNQLRREYVDELKIFDVLLDEWKDISNELVGVQQEITSKRAQQQLEIEEKLNLFSTPNMNVSIRLLPESDREDFIDYLTEKGHLQGLGNWKVNRLSFKVATACNPIEFTQLILLDDNSRLKDKINANLETTFENTHIERLYNSLHPFSMEENADVKVVDKDKLEKLLTTAEVKWDDEESILLNERPVQNLSPGQRSSAMLPLIALVEDAPLIVDQPEDNLDNRLVGNMLVDILTSLKEKRQIIVATHNPNIVVSGDAEQVIVLDAISIHEGECIESGSVDNQDIVKSIIELMEGGKTAFLTRKKRYGY